MERDQEGERRRSLPVSDYGADSEDDQLVGAGPPMLLGRPGSEPEETEGEDAGPRARHPSTAGRVQPAQTPRKRGHTRHASKHASKCKTSTVLPKVNPLVNMVVSAR